MDDRYTVFTLIFFSQKCSGNRIIDTKRRIVPIGCQNIQEIKFMKYRYGMVYGKIKMNAQKMDKR